MLAPTSCDQAATADAPIYATPECYDALVTAFRERANELGLSYSTIDDLAGVTSGFVGKAFGGSQTKRLGWLSTYLILPVLGLRLALLEDNEAAKLYANRAVARKVNQARANNFAQSPNRRAIVRVIKHLLDHADMADLGDIIAKASVAGSGDCAGDTAKEVA